MLTSAMQSESLPEESSSDRWLSFELSMRRPSKQDPTKSTVAETKLVAGVVIPIYLSICFYELRQSPLFASVWSRDLQCAICQ